MKGRFTESPSSLLRGWHHTFRVYSRYYGELAERLHKPNKARKALATEAFSYVPHEHE